MCVCLARVSASVCERGGGGRSVGRSVGRRAVGRSVGRREQPQKKVRTPHNDVGKKMSPFLDPRKPLAKAARKPWISDYLLGLGFRFEGLGFKV